MGSWFTANRKLQIQVDIQIRKMSKYKLSKMTIPFPYVILRKVNDSETKSGGKT